MGRKYRFHDNSKLYFVTFTVIHWIDVFTRQEYRDVIYNSIGYCQEEKGLEVYCYCIMPSHIHMIIGTSHGILPDIVRDFKAFTSRHIRKAIEEHRGESRKEWMIPMMSRAGISNKRNKDWQFWQQQQHPVELNNYPIALQRLNYIHNNPVVSGFVDKAEEWVHSSAGDYCSIRKGPINLILIE